MGACESQLGARGGRPIDKAGRSVTQHFHVRPLFGGMDGVRGGDPAYRVRWMVPRRTASDEEVQLSFVSSFEPK